MTGPVLVLVEPEEGRASLVSREALTFARQLGDPVHALVLGAATEAALQDCREQGAAVVHEATNPELGRYAAAAWGTALAQAAGEAKAPVVLAGGTPRGTEVLAHLAARYGQPMAANVVQVVQADPLEVERQVAGGSVLERVRVNTPGILTVAGHAVAPEPAPAAGAGELRRYEARLRPGDLRAQVVRTEARSGGDSSALTGARVVVGAGRGAGGPDGFGAVDALASRLGGAVGVSRVVTSLGWRPHHEQVGQTGSRIAPEVYIACGISGAIQHWAGCASSKTIIAINTDAEAPMVTKADYAVIGDMHEVIPAILEELG
ncbi:electron transfer flavoprotein subunit alpha/FixB family protein [Ornithinicoccus hortensis]|uniref:Electron transfer flavoprotein alpha subunit apoprotein n=1 Tax=Ornithinicoccus hortensis TaxID=82346 RepID=A0A542YSC5_9MICO|nr:electron transfer flavoprotein subunit alpha/FixB family protein [Ornithinicoccus hortensis]TQL50951.1 electron transfer flavoprotein alpha subunit apoprotein [Ornithinicoccus hortensis]